MIVDLESSLNAVLTRMRPVQYFSTASKAFAIERFADTGRLSAGSRMTTTRARDGNERRRRNRAVKPAPAMATTVADEKKNLRAIMIACRDALPGERAAAWSEIVQRQVIASESYRDASAVVLYAAIGNEVSTDRILADALASDRAVFYPRVDAVRLARSSPDASAIAPSLSPVPTESSSRPYRRKFSTAKVSRKFSSVFPALPSDSKGSDWVVAGVIMIVSSANSAAKRSLWGSPIHSSCSIESPRRDSTGGLTSL